MGGKQSKRLVRKGALGLGCTKVPCQGKQLGWLSRDGALQVEALEFVHPIVKAHYKSHCI